MHHQGPGGDGPPSPRLNKIPNVNRVTNRNEADFDHGAGQANMSNYYYEFSKRIQCYRIIKVPVVVVYTVLVTGIVIGRKHLKFRCSEIPSQTRVILLLVEMASRLPLMGENPLICLQNFMK